MAGTPRRSRPPLHADPRARVEGVRSLRCAVWVCAAAVASAQFDSENATWASVTNGAAWSPRPTRSGAVQLGGTVYLVGTGINGTSTPLSDVWRSTDAVNWTLSTPAAAFPPRLGACVLGVYPNLFLLGGVARDAYGVSRYLNDVWASTVTSNGSVWTNVTIAAAWPGRAGAVCFRFNRAIWVMSGATPAVTADAWRSVDNGATWLVMPLAPRWSPRAYASAAEFAGKLYIAGGTNFATSFADVWSTANGQDWEALPTPGWRARDSACLLVWPPAAVGSVLPALWMLGGRLGGPAAVAAAASAATSTVGGSPGSSGIVTGVTMGGGSVDDDGGNRLRKTPVDEQAAPLPRSKRNAAAAAVTATAGAHESIVETHAGGGGGGGGAAAADISALDAVVYAAVLARSVPPAVHLEESVRRPSVAPGDAPTPPSSTGQRANDDDYAGAAAPRVLSDWRSRLSHSLLQRLSNSGGFAAETPSVNAANFNLGARTVNFNLGGATAAEPGSASDVWRTDVATLSEWALVESAAPWGPRSDFGCVQLGGNIIVLGGQSGAAASVAAAPQREDARSSSHRRARGTRGADAVGSSNLGGVGIRNTGSHTVATAAAAAGAVAAGALSDVAGVATHGIAASAATGALNDVWTSTVNLLCVENNTLCGGHGTCMPNELAPLLPLLSNALLFEEGDEGGVTSTTERVEGDEGGVTSTTERDEEGEGDAAAGAAYSSERTHVPSDAAGTAPPAAAAAAAVGSSGLSLSRASSSSSSSAAAVAAAAGSRAAAAAAAEAYVWSPHRATSPILPPAYSPAAAGYGFVPPFALNCTCDEGWMSARCSDTLCNAQTCVHGSCVPTNVTGPDGLPYTIGQCVCTDTTQWNGTQCNSPVCATGCSSLHGSCSRPGECVCAEGWGGPRCTIALDRIQVIGRWVTEHVTGVFVCVTGVGIALVCVYLAWSHRASYKGGWGDAWPNPPPSSSSSASLLGGGGNGSSSGRGGFGFLGGRGGGGGKAANGSSSGGNMYRGGSRAAIGPDFNLGIGGPGSPGDAYGGGGETGLGPDRAGWGSGGEVGADAAAAAAASLFALGGSSLAGADGSLIGAAAALSRAPHLGRRGAAPNSSYGTYGLAAGLQPVKAAKRVRFAGEEYSSAPPPLLQ